MSKEEFAEEGVKLYIGHLENSGSMSEVEDILSDYEDSINYIRDEYFGEKINDTANAIKEGKAVADFDLFYEKVIQKLEEVEEQYGIHNDSELERYVQNLINDLKACDIDKYLEDEKEF